MALLSEVDADAHRYGIAVPRSARTACDTRCRGAQTDDPGGGCDVAAGAKEGMARTIDDDRLVDVPNRRAGAAEICDDAVRLDTSAHVWLSFKVGYRLFSYIKNGKPYPEEFHYGPGRLPPPNPHLRTASRASVTHSKSGSQ